MKKLFPLLIFVVLLFVSATNIFSQGPVTRPVLPLEQITVTGKVIVDSVNRFGARFFLDTDNNGTKDYQLSFGPPWYKPVSGAQKPVAGQTVTIKGDVFSNATPPLVMVIEINGLKWRDSVGFKFVFNPVKFDSIRGRFNPCGNRFGWATKDSLIEVTLTGKVTVDSLSINHKIYSLDNNNDGIKDYILMFGPFWYEAKSGAKRPSSGDIIRIKGGLLQRPLSTNDTLKFVIIYEINDLKWIDSVGRYPWPGNIVGRDHHLSTRISSMYNSNTYCTFEPNSFGHGMGMMDNFWDMFSKDLYSSIMEIDPLYVPVTIPLNIVGAYSVSVMDNNMNGILFPFDKSISVNLSYNKKDLTAAGVPNANLKLLYLADNNTPIEVPNAKFNYSTSSVSFSQVIPSGMYIITSDVKNITSVEDKGVPEKFTLMQNYPNPFNPSTTISFSLPQKDDVKLKIYSLIGTEVKELINQNLEAGIYNFSWDGTNNLGNTVSTGVYFYKLETGLQTITKKMNLLK